MNLNKRAQEWEIGKLIIVVLVLIVLIAGFILLKTRGGDLLTSIQNFMHFGRA